MRFYNTEAAATPPPTAPTRNYDEKNLAPSDYTAEPSGAPVTIPEGDSSTTLPIWRGRRGGVALLIIGAMALACGFGLMKFAERACVAVCRDYAQAHGWRYVSLFTYADPTIKRSGAICTFKDEHGSPADVHLNDISLPTDLWVSLSVNLMLTIPAFALLFAVLRTWLWKRGLAS